MLEKGNYSLSEIHNEIKLFDKHRKYNFYIQPVKNNDKITIDGNGSFQMYLMNETLNFYANDEISLDIIMENLNYTKNITLVLNATKDLECKDIGKHIKRCVVPRSHFQNKQSGYYYIYHLNHVNKYVKFYEHSPIHITIPIIIRIKDIYEQ